jgi:hypothetical protein
MEFCKINRSNSIETKQKIWDANPELLPNINSRTPDMLRIELAMEIDVRCPLGGQSETAVRWRLLSELLASLLLDSAA